MEAVPVSVRQNTPEWEEARLDGIGSSDAAVIAGERGSVWELWATKTRRIPPAAIDEETARIYRLGHRLEPVIADEYTEITGRPVRRVARMLRRKDTPWAFASLDRVSAVKGERRIVELKTAPWSTWGIGEDVPGAVQAQVQHQLYVTGYDVADVAVLVRGYDLRVHEIERDDAFIDDLVFLERDFYRRVQTGEAPPVDGSDATTKALLRMFPRETGEILPATPDLAKLADDLYIAQGLLKAAKKQEATVKNAIRAILGDAAGVEGDGFRLTWTKNRDSTETNWEAIAKAYRAVLDALNGGESEIPSLDDVAAGLPEGELRLVELLDAIQSLHTTTKPGARVLRPWWANGKHDQDADKEAA